MSDNPQPPKRPRHLMDPDNLQASYSPKGMSLSTVQKTVMSSLAAVTILHLAVGLVIAAMAIDDSRTDARIGLNVIAGAFGVISVISVLLIHGRSLLSPWLLLGALVTPIGLWLTFR